MTSNIRIPWNTCTNGYVMWVPNLKISVWSLHTWVVTGDTPESWTRTWGKDLNKEISWLADLDLWPRLIFLILYMKCVGCTLVHLFIFLFFSLGNERYIILKWNFILSPSKNWVILNRFEKHNSIFFSEHKTNAVFGL